MDLQPIEITPEQLEAVQNPKRSEYLRNSMLKKLFGVCAICGNTATQTAVFRLEGATRLEKFCDNCIKENKHIQQSDFMQNFDNYFIRAEYGFHSYDTLNTYNKNDGPDYFHYRARSKT